ncbi:MAG: hypothetical protein AAGC55_20690 [Myxococcota bacterium]
MMDRDRPVECRRDKENKIWRIQCDETTKVCLYAPNDELNSRGQRSKPLERAKRCRMFDNQRFDRAKYEAQGYTFVAGRPDAPHGWTRDNRGRVFQINFDLRRRMYIGGSYAPWGAYAPTAAKQRMVESKRSSIDFGLLAFEYFGGDSNPTRHRIRLVEGALHLTPFSAELTLLRYSLSRRFLNPLLRVTTFFGEPVRHDLNFNVGLWSEGGRVEVHPSPSSDSTLWKFGAAQATLDLWQSAQLDSFMRLRGGIGIERLFTDEYSDRTAITFGSAFEIDWVLDQAGFHNLQAELTYEIPRYTRAHEVIGASAQRMTAGVEYEAILLAINDQPLSFRLRAGGEKRNDLPGVPYDWAFVANAGLRFSLWAPPRPQQ